MAGKEKVVGVKDSKKAVKRRRRVMKGGYFAVTRTGENELKILSPEKQTTQEVIDWARETVRSGAGDEEVAFTVARLMRSYVARRETEVHTRVLDVETE